MKVTPMIFNGDMVRAMLREVEKPGSGKTQTRRIVKQDMASNFDEPRGAEDVAAGYPFVETEAGFISAVKLCPYGQPGDLIYVRETFGVRMDGRKYYRADQTLGQLNVDKWASSIHMPRWASRITLEITSVRVERLQDISRADAAAEGMCYPDGYDRPAWLRRDRWPEENFATLWQAIYGHSAWHANPWVWVIEYKPMLVNVDEYIKQMEAHGNG